ncbi:Ig-like domain-containing protein [Arthrobacter stackebrandtii]|nr:Ig-like domain-containing protein [Arthrobacter stackebrandtii]
MPPGIPQVESFFPSSGANQVPPRTQIMATFDKTAAPYADAIDFRVRNEQDTSVMGAVSFNESVQTAVFSPRQALVPGTYSAEVKLTAGPNGVEALASWSFTVPVKTPLEQGPGGAILLITNAGTFDSYYAEILRAEGLNNFTTVDVAELSQQDLAGHHVAIIGPGAVTAQQSQLLETWVGHGGNLLAMRPSGPLAELAGVRPAGMELPDGYLQIDTAKPPGQGLVGETMQFHGPADQLGVTADAEVVATLFSDAATSLDKPAVTLRTVGTSGGQVAAFSYDVATSVVLARQGNPEWAGQDRDGKAPIRPNDLFFGQADGDAAADFVDLDKAVIPQADEQMRLVSRLISDMHADKGPLPRFWYFPNGIKAVLVMASDDHGTNDGTRKFFDRMLALGPENCRVDRWECARATSWMYPSTHMSDGQASDYAAAGFDLGAHSTTHCQNWSEQSLQQAFSRDLRAFRLAFPSLPNQRGSRIHCIAWSDWTTQVEVERAWGIRMDMNYYYWPGSWVQGRAGFMTGSGLPMRFSDSDGALLNVYQQATHLVDTTFVASPQAVEGLLQRALGPEGYYGAFGTHYDFSNDFDIQLTEIATRLEVPMVSAEQLLEWTDGRNSSTLDHENWDGSTLLFEVHADDRTNSMLRTMLPLESTAGTLQQLRGLDGPVNYTVESVKGVDYAMFAGTTGSYAATYG